MVALEDLLWVTVAAGIPFMMETTSWQTLLLLAVSIVGLFVDPAKLSSIRKKRKVDSTEIGLQMSIVMVPVLLQIMAYRNGDSQWDNYSKLATLLVIPNYSVSVVFCAIATNLDPTLDKSIACFFMISWFLLQRMVAATLTKSFTFGELRAVVLILIVVGAEFSKTIFDGENAADYPSPSTLYPLVTLAGSISCLGIACLCNTSQMLSWWPKLALNVVGPLSFVDLSLYTTTNFRSSDIFMPLSIQWLIGFLMEKENDLERIWGLVYWGGVLAVLSYPTYTLLSLPSNRKASVVVTRKWFHLIAILLFGPTTWQFPQLMSLSYAIASCILVVLETLRSDAPILQSFYTEFLDDRKDDGGQIIVSHIFLIIGCAVSLWVSQILSNQDTLSLLVAEFGVLCIGIGDAMGAVVGKSIGKHKWGKNQRTLEGSLAMWLSMVVAGASICSSMRECVALLIATTVTTILEAFTVQLDNLVLPIVGCSIILLILTP